MNFIRLDLNLPCNLLFVKEIDASSPNYINDLEEKIVELSLKLKAKENEINTFKKGELLLFKDFCHNLINPLGVINSFSHMFLEGGKNNFSEKEQKYLEIIQNSSGFSLNFLNSFSEYYSLKNSNKTLEISTIYLFQTILQEVEVFKKLASERNILIEIKEPKEEVYLSSDENKLKKIVKALLYNAIRFSKNNSKIKVEFILNSETVEIKITDQGIGISKDNLSKIYNEFFVCSTYDVAKIKCIGLGLSISKILTDSLNGELKIKSELDKGTSVSLILKKG